MKKNYYTVITGSEVVLVSYKKEHVPKYHEWMKSKELQKLTASEPLTLQEEYKMQMSWLHDKNKCTFIILDKELYSETRDEVESMIGDTNLFFVDPENPFFAEAEIMIAEEEFRRKKRGWEAMLLMLHYGISELKITKYQVKIAVENEISINMFKKMGFEFSERSDIFKEITLVKDVTPQWRNWIEINVNFIKIKNCDIKMIASVFAQRRAQQQKEKEKKEKEQKDKELKEKEEKKLKESEEKDKEQKEEDKEQKEEDKATQEAGDKEQGAVNEEKQSENEEHKEGDTDKKDGEETDNQDTKSKDAADVKDQDNKENEMGAEQSSSDDKTQNANVETKESKTEDSVEKKEAEKPEQTGAGDN